MKLFTDLSSQSDGLRAAVNLLKGWRAVATGVICRTVEDLATITWAQNVVVTSKWIAPFSAEFV
jgi:hypothetical protein